MIHPTFFRRFFFPVFVLLSSSPALATTPVLVLTDRWAADATGFLQREIAAHVAAVTNLDPPQKMVLGVPTAGDFTWGSFMRALAVISSLSGETNIAGRDVPQFLGQLGLIEARQGGKTFSQLGAAITLRQFGLGLQTNRLWQSLSPSEQNEWRALLNPERFYDPKTHHVIGLPENYMGVASRIAVYDYQMGLTADRQYADDILTRAAGQFLHGARYTDDNLPTGRFDRYSQEYARFIFDASKNLGREDVQTAVRPALKAVMPTWWALVSPDGYGYPWGRTIGDMSYLDTMEIIGFVAEHPEFRPAPLSNLAGVYVAAWESLLRDYQSDRHLLNMFGFGRGNYHYMTVERQWQQTTGFLAKAGDSLQKLMAALRAEGITAFPARPALPEVARFDFFRDGDRPAGAWLVRRGLLTFALPLSTGVRPGIADYLPAPHALPGFAAPVEQLVPVLTPYLQLEDGRTVVAGDGADAIKPAADGTSVRAVWKRWALVNFEMGRTNGDLPFGEAETFADPGLVSEVTWKIDGNTLRRTERITATKPVKIRTFSVLFPSTAETVETRLQGKRRADRFIGADATLEVSVERSSAALSASVQATGNSALGKGTRGPIPLLLKWEAQNISLNPKGSWEWELVIRRLR
jgi:hypothetical protein